MPKKKLTKAQVKRASAQIIKNMYNLMLDKLGHGTASFWPMSYNKTVEVYRAIQSAALKMK